MLIVADSSPLIALGSCQCLQLLDQLSDELKVPQAVFDEVVIKGKPAAEQLYNYLQEKTVSVDSASIITNAGGLGRGELETMALYKQLNADFLLVDDKRARKIAKLNQIKITGSQGILLLAKQKGLISLVKPFIEQLRNSDIYIHERVISRVLQLADETGLN